MTRKLAHHIMFFAVSVVLAVTAVQQAFPQAQAGQIEGRLVFADNTGVEKAGVKIVDKLEVFQATSPANPGFTVQHIAIARDATVMETSTDKQGTFRVFGLHAGTYYIFYKVQGAFQGDGWIYQYHQPTYIAGYLAGYMHKPDEYTVESGRVTTIPDIEIVRRLVSCFRNSLTTARLMLYSPSLCGKTLSHWPLQSKSVALCRNWRGGAILHRR